MSLPGVAVAGVDLTIDSLQEGALAVLNIIRPNWRPEDIIFKVYTAGRCNRLIGCHLIGDADYQDSVLIRLYGEHTDQLVDRDLENTIMYILSAASCCKPLYARLNNGIAYGFTPGECISLQSAREPHIARLVADEMARYHNIDPAKYSDSLTSSSLKHLNMKKPCIFTKIKQYLSIARKTFADPETMTKYPESIPSLDVLTEEIEELEKRMDRLGSPVVFCHNDLLMDNIVYSITYDRCYFIDFEFTDFNYQAFDIATHFCEWAGVENIDFDKYPDKPTQLTWLSDYLKSYKTYRGLTDTEPRGAEVETLYEQVHQFSLVSHLFCAMCSIIQINNSTLDFDYLKYAKARLDEYYKTKDQCLSLELALV